MRYLKLPSIVIVMSLVLGFTASRAQSAEVISVHPSVCVLVQNSSPYNSIAASYTNARFMNTSGGTANGICPVTLHDVNTQFRVSTTSASTFCHVQAISNSGTVTIISGSHSNNHWTFSVSGLDAGTQSAFVSCALANNTGIYHLVNY